MVATSQRLTLSVRERLLLHLLPLQRYESEFEVPVTLTQAGISSSTGIARPNVSRGMKLLQNKGLVYEKLSHIKRHKRQKKVYLLTATGVIQAQEFEISLGRAKLKVRTHEGNVEERTIDEISERVPGKPSKLDIIKSLDRNGLCDYNTLAAIKISAAAGVGEAAIPEQLALTEAVPERLFIQEFHPPLELRHFFGRSLELTNLKNWLDEDYPRLIYVHGLPGIGKTTLGLEMVRNLRERTNIFWYGLKEWDNLGNVIKSLSAFLEKLGRSKLRSYYERTRNVEPAEVADIMTEDLAGMRTLIVLDDFQRATPSIVTLFSSLMQLLQHQYRVKIVLLSRKLVKFYDRRDVVLKKTVAELKLEGLDEVSSRRLLGAPTLTEDEFSKVYVMTGGHPLYLELLESAANLDEHEDMLEFLHEEIFSKLSEPERKMLMMASVYRYPILAEAFFEEPDLSYSHIDALAERSYLVRQGINLFDTHDLVKNYFYNRQTKSELNRNHKLAADYYINLLSQWGLTKPPKRGQKIQLPPGQPHTQMVEAMLEVQYHLLRCNEPKKALELTLLYGKVLIETGKFELLLIIDDLKLAGMPVLTRARVSALKGEVLTNLGDTAEAIKQLHSSLKLFGEAGRASERALVLTLIGENYAVREKWTRAEKFHIRSQAILKSIPVKLRSSEDKYALARSFNNMGLASKMTGDVLKAMDFYKKSLKLLEHERLGTVQDHAGILENLGLIMVEIDQLDMARDYFEKALGELEGEGDYSGLAKLFATLGDIYVELGDIPTATDFFEKGVQYWARTEDVGHATKTFLRLSQVYSEKVLGAGPAFRPVARPSYWERLQRLFSTIREEDYRKISKLYDRIGGLYMHRGYWHKSMEFHQRALELFEKFRDDRGLAKVYNNLGVLYRTSQEPVKALECYKKAVSYLEKINERRGLAITHLNIGRLYERMDNVEQSRRAYEDCLNVSRTDDQLQHYQGLALLGLTRQTPVGTSMRKQYLAEADAIFKRLDDKENQVEVEKLKRKK